ncbi:hypothetical protein MPTK1_7g08790 [Marchantia polymorpha subsp. ruderalis]|uniref:Uncharacterized protein n=2 Tax=Marchantia polymorpha TaxID=3197 RepID=A0AAF6BXJ4_MARPO|nr:hypothetical protein MARPO_0068s0032 [Marchantia polymorpha]BBN16728.1 hypothetical protein Mp_7g08790 [Marchantia polymorpha subsp. ruderalis]|eukprot:PTQ35810.1 hypothetical protein MARPO_0068s0032 [Marchantia polymorpha]
MASMCIASSQWKAANLQLLTSLSSALESSGYRLKFSSISPDFIFNQSGVSVAFIVALSWEQLATSTAWDRLAKMDGNFQRSYLLTPLSSDERFIELYFRYKQRTWKPLLIPIRDWNMALKTMLVMVSAHAESKQQDAVSPVVIEQLEFVSSTEAVEHALCAIPGLEVHDVHSLMYGIGPIEAISQASAETILEFTDLSKEKARGVEEFFGNEIYNRTPVLE